MIYVKALLLMAVLFLAITFGIQNSESVTLRYYFDLASIPLPLYLVLYAAIILGVIVGLMIDVQSRFSLRKKLKTLQKTNASLREDLEKLRREAPQGPEAEPSITGRDVAEPPSYSPPSPPVENETEEGATSSGKDDD